MYIYIHMYPKKNDQIKSSWYQVVAMLWRFFCFFSLSSETVLRAWKFSGETTRTRTAQFTTVPGQFVFFLRSEVHRVSHLGNIMMDMGAWI